MSDDRKFAKESVRFFLEMILQDESHSFSKIGIVVWRPVYTKQSLDTLYTNIEENDLDIDFGTGLAGKVAENHQSIDKELHPSDSVYHEEIVKKYGWRYVHIFPIKRDNTLVGVCGFYSKSEISINNELLKKWNESIKCILSLCDIICDSHARDQALEDSLLALEIGKAAEDRFHDIKETLFGAMGAVSSIKRDERTLKGSRILKNATLIENQIRKARDYSDKYIQEAKNPDQLNFKELNLSSFINIISREFRERNKHRRKARSRTIDVYFDVPDIDIIINADQERLYRAINNILYNAEYWVVQSIGLNSRVDITLDYDDTTAFLKVRDTGPGVIDTAKILEKGYSLRGGTGLGLAIAKKIFRLHGGKLEVQSEPTLWTAVLMDIPIVRLDEIRGR